MKPLLRLTMLAVTAVMSLAVQAADVATDAIQAAYAPYRVALFRTNGKSQPEAQQAIAQAQQAWKGVTERFAGNAPAPYDRDPDFSAALAKVRSIYEKAATEIAANQLPAAHETLEEARDVLAVLRQRNGVVVFSDHMNAYHTEMEHLLTEGPKALSGTQGLYQVMARVGAMDYLAQELRRRAPATLAQNAEFDVLLKDVEASVAGVKSAVLSQDAETVKAAIGKVKAPYSKLFLKFG